MDSYMNLNVYNFPDGFKFAYSFEGIVYSILKGLFEQYRYGHKWGILHYVSDDSIRKAVENHFLEKGFYVGIQYSDIRVCIWNPQENDSDYRPSVRRIDAKDLLYLVFRRCKNARIFEPLVFRIIREYL